MYTFLGQKLYAFFEIQWHVVINFSKMIRFKKRRHMRLATYILIFFLESMAYFLLVKKLYFVFLSKLTMVCPIFGKRERWEDLQNFLKRHLVLVVGQIIWLTLKNVNCGKVFFFESSTFTCDRIFDFFFRFLLIIPNTYSYFVVDKADKCRWNDGAFAYLFSSF
jgi:hypothetical protein